jgi:lysophospholipase L1-like esterase
MRAGSRVVLAAAGVLLAAGPALASETDPCTPNLWPRRTAAAAETVLGDAPLSAAMVAFLRSDAARAAAAARRQAQAVRDWAGLCEYRADNVALTATGARPDLVTMGDSLTDNWVFGDPALFGPRIVGRGIAGQVTGQMLGRFQQDVIALHPKAVHILGGTNDISGAWGPSRLEDIQSNIAAMADIARAHGLRVLVGSLTPATELTWAPEVRPAAEIVAMNVWLKAYTRANGLTYVDYYTALAGPDGGMKPGLSADGVHPNRRAYALMRKALEAALAGQ